MINTILDILDQVIDWVSGNNYAKEDNIYNYYTRQEGKQVKHTEKYSASRKSNGAVYAVEFEEITYQDGTIAYVETTCQELKPGGAAYSWSHVSGNADL